MKESGQLCRNVRLQFGSYHTNFLRKVLESQAAVWAAERGAPDKVQELAKLLESVREEIKERSSGHLLLLGEHDIGFHLCLVEAVRNQVLARVMHHLLDLMAEASARSWSIPGRPEKSVDEHARVVEAILAHDPALAREAMHRHLENVEKELL